MRLSESYIWAPRMPGPWSHQSVERELCLRPRLIYGKMSFRAWLCSSTDLVDCGYIGYSLQSSSCPQEQVSWFRPQRGAQRPGLSVSSFPVGWATITPSLFSKGSFENDALSSLGCWYLIRITKPRNTRSVYGLEAEKSGKNRCGPFTA